MITQKQFDDLAAILFDIKHQCQAWIKTPAAAKDKHAFTQQIRKLAHDIELWTDDVEAR